jgi:hypothetical protein
MVKIISIDGVNYIKESDFKKSAETFQPEVVRIESKVEEAESNIVEE